MPVKTLLLALLALWAAPAARGDGGFSAVTLRAQVRDPLGQPVAGIAVRFDAMLEGVARALPGGPSARCADRLTRRAVTDRDGEAAVPIGGREPWFRGSVQMQVSLPGKATVAEQVTVEGTRAQIVAYPPPDRMLGRFPVWTGADGRLDRIVVVVEGFDLSGQYTPVTVLALLGAPGTYLRQRGIDLLVVDLGAWRARPDRYAPQVREAILAAQGASGRPVAVAGLSAGGLVARWALCDAEDCGAPLPVNALLCLDTPHRGAQLPLALQALIARNGEPSDRDAIRSDAARALLRRSVDWDRCRWSRLGLHGKDWGADLPRGEIPWESAYREAFFQELKRKGCGGYPVGCRVVGVANSDPGFTNRYRQGYRLWGPLDALSRRFPADPADGAPGSLLPAEFVGATRRKIAGGLAGGYLPDPPTFVPYDSARDAGPGEPPPFARFYAARRGPRAHDRIDWEIGAPVAGEILSLRW